MGIGFCRGIYSVTITDLAVAEIRRVDRAAMLVGYYRDSGSVVVDGAVSCPDTRFEGGVLIRGHHGASEAMAALFPDWYYVGELLTDESVADDCAERMIASVSKDGAYKCRRPILIRNHGDDVETWVFNDGMQYIGRKAWEGQ